MTPDVALVFPHQLFPDHPALRTGRDCVLVEDGLFFTQLPFHAFKLVLHRASMKGWAEEQERKGIRVDYVGCDQAHHRTETLFTYLAQKGAKKVVVADVHDYLLERRLMRYADRSGLTLEILDTPAFLLGRSDVDAFYAGRKRYFLQDFYVHQRKQRGILLDAAGGPLGGKWSFDEENRNRLGAHVAPPVVDFPASNVHVREAIRYVRTHFPANPGNPEQFHYPVNRAQALEGFRAFLSSRFHDFGKYQDAVVQRQTFLFHSLLAPSLNTGLLLPQEVIEGAVEYGLAHDVPLASIEGFVRQILGWREYIRAVYMREGSRERTTNFWGHGRKIPASFWNGTTGIPPVDMAIRRVDEHAYTHHIERLMVLGNFMCLCGFDPDEVYRWFMSLFIDAYDWVMVPNVYGMSLHADGGLMSTKPYISGSNYVLKMSDHPKGAWCDTWDGLFWSFIARNRSFFEKNPRLSMMVRQLDRMDSAKLGARMAAAERFLDGLEPG